MSIIIRFVLLVTVTLNQGEVELLLLLLLLASFFFSFSSFIFCIVLIRFRQLTGASPSVIMIDCILSVFCSLLSPFFPPNNCSLSPTHTNTCGNSVALPSAVALLELFQCFGFGRMVLGGKPYFLQSMFFVTSCELFTKKGKKQRVILLSCLSLSSIGPPPPRAAPALILERAEYLSLYVALFTAAAYRCPFRLSILLLLSR